MKKKRRSKRPKRDDDDLAPEYRFDYSKMKPNRFASRFPPGEVVSVTLAPDVARVLKDPARINALLRAAIEAVDRRPARRARRP